MRAWFQTAFIYSAYTFASLHEHDCCGGTHQASPPAPSHSPNQMFEKRKSKDNKTINKAEIITRKQKPQPAASRKEKKKHAYRSLGMVAV